MKRISEMTEAVLKFIRTVGTMFLKPEISRIKETNSDLSLYGTLIWQRVILA